MARSQAPSPWRLPSRHRPAAPRPPAAAEEPDHHAVELATLRTAQTLAWASSYSLPAILAAPMAADLGVSVPTVFAAFSLALVVSADVGPWAWRAIDSHGGRPVLMMTSGMFVVGPAALALAQDPLGLFAAWAVLGVAMGSGLDEAAFSTLVHTDQRAARAWPTSRAYTTASNVSGLVPQGTPVGHGLAG